MRLSVAGIVAFVSALVVRLAFVIDDRASPFLAYRLIDEQDYHVLATRLLHGAWPGHEALFRPPLYPVFLAGVYRAFGDDVLTARLVQCGVGALAAPLTVWIAARVLGSVRHALAAGLVVAACGPLVYYDAQLLAASLDVVLVLAAVALVLRADERGRARDWAVAGAALGLAATNRGSMLLVVPVVAAWAVATRARGVPRAALAKPMAALAAAAVMVVAPLAWHNAQNDERPEASYAPEARSAPTEVASGGVTLARMATGRACLLGWAQGINLYVGNVPELADLNDDANVEHFHWFNRLSAEPWKDGARTAYEHSAWFSSRTRRFVVEHPGRWLVLLASKVLEVLGGYEVARGTSPYAERETSHVLSLLLWSGPVRFPSGLLLPLGLVGGLVLRRERRALLVALVAATQLLFVVAFFVTSRYRLPALPLAAVLAVGAIARAVRGVRARSVGSGRALAWAAAVGALVVVCNVRLGAQSVTRSAVEHYDLADQLTRDGDGDGAVAHLRASIAIAPRFGDAHAYLGYLYVRAGRPKQAMAEYVTAAELDRDDPAPRVALGRLCLAAQDREGAARWLDEARALGSKDPQLPALLDATRRIPAVSGGP